jgi:hypothetical protein
MDERKEEILGDGREVNLHVPKPRVPPHASLRHLACPKALELGERFRVALHDRGGGGGGHQAPEGHYDPRGHLDRPPAILTLIVGAILQDTRHPQVKRTRHDSRFTIHDFKIWLIATRLTFLLA